MSIGYYSQEKDHEKRKNFVDLLSERFLKTNVKTKPNLKRTEENGFISNFTKISLAVGAWVAVATLIFNWYNGWQQRQVEHAESIINSMIEIRSYREIEEMFLCKNGQYAGNYESFIKQQQPLLKEFAKKMNAYSFAKDFSDRTFKKALQFSDTLRKNPGICTEGSPSYDELLNLQRELVVEMKKD